jgi:hypothetical protein
MQFKKRSITPKLASKWLESNENNRGLSQPTWMQYARLMKAGRWGECPQPIILNGQKLIDGQHRLRAIIEYGKPISMWVCSGASEKTRELIDKGRGRSPADTLKIEYGMQYATRTCAMAKQVSMYQGTVQHKMSHYDVLDTVKGREKSFGTQEIPRRG